MLEYEKSRLTLIGDVEVVALEGYCSECKQRPVLPLKRFPLKFEKNTTAIIGRH